MQFTPVNIYDETATLKKAAVFGPPGIEAYIAQFLPPEISLFMNSFDVKAAQGEYLQFIELMNSMGIEVVNLKEVYAGTLGQPKVSAKELLGLIQQKYPQAETNMLEGLLHADARMVGEGSAIALNYELSLKHGLPLANIYFARDQANVICRSLVFGSMKYLIRQPEVAIMEKAIAHLGHYGIITPAGTFEGGDALVFGGKIFIGQGSRTSMDAAQKLAKVMSLLYSYEVYIVQALTHDENSKEGWVSNMQTMHLDTVMMPVAPKTLLGCLEVLEHYTALKMPKGKAMPLLESLDGHSIISVPQEEQKNYAANVLVVQPGTVIVPSDYNLATNSNLAHAGINIISAKMKELTGGTGATHCSVLSLVRG